MYINISLLNVAVVSLQMDNYIIIIIILYYIIIFILLVSTAFYCILQNWE